MPQNKRESLIYTFLMCFLMVLWMSIYNVALHNGEVSLQIIREGWLGFPIAFIYALIMDWFIVSKRAKGVAFRFLIKPNSSSLKKVISISCCMVIPMVVLMSLYGGLEACFSSGNWNQFLLIWLSNVPKNIVMALPFQLIIAGPVARKIFRSVIPEGMLVE